MNSTSDNGGIRFRYPFLVDRVHLALPSLVLVFGPLIFIMVMSIEILFLKTDHREFRQKYFYISLKSMPIIFDSDHNRTT